jgi:hypothetical protein
LQKKSKGDAVAFIKLSQPKNTFPDFESNFHIKPRNHGIKVCSPHPLPHYLSLGMESILALFNSRSGRGGLYRFMRARASTNSTPL